MQSAVRRLSIQTVRLMRNLLFTMAFIGTASLITGCAHNSLYQSWGQQLNDLAKRNGKVDDVSLLLGSPPTRCDPVAAPNPIIGVQWDPKRPLILSVMPGGPAERAGLRPNDTVINVGGRPVENSEEFRSTLRSNLRPGEPLQFQTDRGSFSVIPRIPVAQQCYWEANAGNVAYAGGAAYVNKWGGSESSSSAAYQRFFRASCRVNDEFIVACQANWQQ